MHQFRPKAKPFDVRLATSRDRRGAANRSLGTGFQIPDGGEQMGGVRFGAGLTLWLCMAGVTTAEERRQSSWPNAGREMPTAARCAGGRAAGTSRSGAI